MNRVFCPTAIALLPLILGIGCAEPSSTTPESATEPVVERETASTVNTSPAPEATTPEAAPAATPPPVAAPEATASIPTAASNQPSAAVTINTLVIPGEQVGPIQRDTDRQALADIFGEDQLTDEAVPVGEGMTEPGTRVDLGNGRSLNVIWADETRSLPLEVRNLDDQWRTPEGIHVGQSISELAGAIGAFEFFGFGWDYGGTVLLESSDLSQYQGLLFVRLSPTNNTSLLNNETAIQGDGLFPSEHPDVAALVPVVNSMVVVLNPAP